MVRNYYILESLIVIQIYISCQDRVTIPDRVPALARVPVQIPTIHTNIDILDMYTITTIITMMIIDIFYHYYSLLDEDLTIMTNYICKIVSETVTGFLL